LHGEGVPQDTGDALGSAEVSQPIPGEDACHGDHEPCAIGGNGLEEGFWSRFHVAVEHKFAIVAYDANVHAAGVQVDPAVKRMLGVVKSPEVSPVTGNIDFPLPAYHYGMLRGEASIIIKALEPTPYSVRCAPAFGSR
jgi:hypothetical protein